MKTFGISFKGYFRVIFGIIKAESHDEALEIAQNELDKIKNDESDSFGFESADYDDIEITEITESGYTFIGTYAG